MLYMSSQSTADGVMQLTVTFALGTDLDKAQVLVQNRVAQTVAKLPEETQRIGIVTEKSSPNITLLVHLIATDERYDMLYLSNYATLRVRDELARLPGVGHKTASVVMAQAFGVPALAVDTHIHRLAQRWGLSSGKNVAETEKDLKRLFPKERWIDLHLQIIYYGREYCSARGCDGTLCPLCRACYPDRKKPKLTRKA